METPRARDGEQRVAADQWDIDGWQILASEAEKASFASANPVYERLVSQFPPIGKFWKSYAEHLARENPDDHDGIKAIYDRAVQAAPTSIEIWRSYVTFASSLAIKVPGSKLETDALATYERAISSAGLDLNANPLWSHYIDFLKKHTTVSDSHRRDALRRVYQRAVMTCTSFFPLLLDNRFRLSTKEPCIRATIIPSLSPSMKKEQILSSDLSLNDCVLPFSHRESDFSPHVFFC